MITITRHPGPGMSTYEPDAGSWHKLGAAIQTEMKRRNIPFMSNASGIVMRNQDDPHIRIIHAWAAYVLHGKLSAIACGRCSSVRRAELHAMMAECASTAWAEAMSEGVTVGFIGSNFARGRGFVEKRINKERASEIAAAKAELEAIQDRSAQDQRKKELVAQIAEQSGKSPEYIRDLLKGFGNGRGQPRKQPAK